MDTQYPPTITARFRSKKRAITLSLILLIGTSPHGNHAWRDVSSRSCPVGGIYKILSRRGMDLRGSKYRCPAVTGGGEKLKHEPRSSSLHEMLSRADGRLKRLKQKVSMLSRGGFEDLEIWLDRSGVDRGCDPDGSPSITLKQYGDKGVGLVAARDLAAGSVVASIPRGICLTSDARDAPAGSLKACAHSICSTAESLADSSKHINVDVVAVTLQLYLEIACREKSTSFPWMALLPRGEIDIGLPALWPTHDRQQLTGSLVLRDVERIRLAAETEWKAVTKAMKKKYRSYGTCLTDDAGRLRGGKHLQGDFVLALPSFENWLEARCIVQSRAYRVGGRYILIPLVDFANHDDDVRYSLAMGDGVFAGTDEIMFSIDRSYVEGEEILASYGDMENAKRLLSFGFVTLTVPMPKCDGCIALPTEAFCDVALVIPSDDSLFEFKDDFLRKALAIAEDDELTMEAIFHIEDCRQSVDWLRKEHAVPFLSNVFPLLRILTATPNDLQRLGVSQELWLQEGASGSKNVNAIIEGFKLARDDSHDRRALRYVTSQCLARLDALDVNINDLVVLKEYARERLAHSPSVSAASYPRELLAATVRVGEALCWYLLFLASRSLSGKCTEGEEAASKERSLCNTVAILCKVSDVGAEV